MDPFLLHLIEDKDRYWYHSKKGDRYSTKETLVSYGIPNLFHLNFFLKM